MRILIIPTTDWFKHPTPHRHHYLAGALKENNDVFVLHFDIFNREAGIKDDSKIQFVPAGGDQNENIAKYYLKNRAVHNKNIKEIIEREDIDIVFGANLLPTIGAFKTIKKMRKRGKRGIGVYDVSDLFPQSAAIYSKNKLNAYIVRTGSSVLFKKNLRLADLVTASSTSFYNFAKDFGCKRVEMATNGVETKRFRPDIDTKDLREKLGLCDNNVIGFVGALERWIELEVPLKKFPDVLKKRKNTKFLIVGGSINSNYETKLHELVKDLGISDNVVFTGFVPYEDVPSYINAMDLTLIPFRKNLEMANMALPDKLFEYMACGKHILSTVQPEVKNVGKDAVNFYKTPEDFVDKALYLLKTDRINNRGLEIVKQYDWNEIAKGLTASFDKYLHSEKIH